MHVTYATVAKYPLGCYSTMFCRNHRLLGIERNLEVMDVWESMSLSLAEEMDNNGTHTRELVSIGENTNC